MTNDYILSSLRAALYPIHHDAQCLYIVGAQAVFIMRMNDKPGKGQGNGETQRSFVGFCSEDSKSREGRTV